MVGPWALSLVLILAAAVYVDSLSYQFVWDDVLTVVLNQKLRDLRNLPEFFRDDLTTLTGGGIEGRYYRPIMATSLALDATLWGPNPAAFHLTNVLLHVAVTFLVGRFLLAWGAGRDVAILAALLFAIHPVHVEVVDFVTQRLDLWLCIGILTCLLAHRHAGEAGRRRTAWELLALGAQALALFSKEVAVTLPVLLILSEGLAPAHTGHPADWAAWRRALVRSLPAWVLTAAFIFFRFPTLQHLAGNRLEGAGLWHRLPGASETLARYVWMSVFPSHMQPFYDLPRPTSFLAPWPLLGILIGLGLLGLLVWWWRWLPLAAFGLAWFVITVIPVTDIVPLSFREMGLADRYLYVPSVGLVILLALGLTKMLGPADGSSPLRRAIGWTALILLLILYPASLLRYAPVWRDNLSLYRRMEEVAPRSPYPRLNLGLIYFEANDLARATAELERAVRLDPRLRRAQAMLALLYVLQARSSEGFRIFDALAADPARDQSYYFARAKADLFVGKPQEALAILDEGVRRYPDRADYVFWLGRALEQTGRPAEAMERYRQAIRMGPDTSLAEEALANLLAQSGNLAEATQHYLRAMELMPDRVQPVRGLALTMEAAGNADESLRLWRQVLEMTPNGAMIKEAMAAIRRLERSASDGASPSNPRPQGARGS